MLCFYCTLVSSEYHSFNPTSSLANSPIVFDLPAFPTGTIYRLNKSILSLRLKIHKPDEFKTKLPDGSQTALV